MKINLITNSPQSTRSIHDFCASALGWQKVFAATQLQFHCRRPLLLAMAMLFLAGASRACETVIWEENFEFGIPPEWSVSAGTWQVGTPTNAGPAVLLV